MMQDLSGEAERQSLLSSLTQVRPKKPVGYLPLYTLRDIAKADPGRIAVDARARGLAAAQFGPAECCIKSGALYMGSVGTLTAAGTPTNPDMFVAYIAAVWIEPDHPAYPLVAKAFGERPQQR